VSVATLTVFIGVLGGVRAYGPLGLFVGPVVLALAIALIKFSLQTTQRVPAAVTPDASVPDNSSESQA
jgi:predicted PurR-regulated permease PerM